MKKAVNFKIVMAIAVILLAGSVSYLTLKSRTEPEKSGSKPAKMLPGIHAPVSIQANPSAKKSTLNGSGPIHYESSKASPINLTDVPRAKGGKKEEARFFRGGDRIESRFTNEQIAEAQANALAQGSTAAVFNLDHSQKPVGFKPKLISSFDSIDAGDCCTGTRFAAFVPPDPDMAAGPNHLIVVVNSAFEVYDKQGNSLTGPIQFATFFDPTQGGSNPGGGVPTAGCTAFMLQFGLQRSAVFDPDVVYDPDADRFIVGIDGGGLDYCIAATQTGDPTGAWNRFGFPTNINGAFSDFPHMGVGEEAIFMGSNQFCSIAQNPAACFANLPFGFQGRVFAIDKTDLYTGTPLSVVTRELAVPGLETPNNPRLDGTPQPSQFQPSAPQFIMSEFFDGAIHSVFSWNDPFGANEWDHVGDVDLATASGVPGNFPVPWPQKKSPEILEGNDFRGQETKFQNGMLWTTQTISCNPGKGVRNCARWAQIDPTLVEPGTLLGLFNLVAGTDGVLQATVIGSDWAYRSFPSIAVNECNDMAVGYSWSQAPGNSGATWYPSIFVAGRQGSDPPGAIGGEKLLKKGKAAYTSFQDNGGVAPVRWGDYTGMTLDPDGRTFWYVGEYAKANVANDFANWATFVGSFKYPGCQ